ncbi:MAG TPA: DNA replication and repair protein RecF, partial [Candidatus Saccharimonadales bacterium]|nr:DNA replication and repair protein RecF [Candidatus Saccharimonadales bacterium]
ILEALYTLSHGTSWRGRDKDMVRHDTTTARLNARLSDKSSRQLELSTPETRLQKKFILNKTTHKRLQFSQKVPVVLFDPDILRTLSGSPSRRRDYLDDLLSRTHANYGVMLHRYERALAQRNELLKSSVRDSSQQWQDHLFVWDIKLAELATYLISARLKLIDLYNQQLSDYYGRIASTPTTLSIVYSATVDPATYSHDMIHALQRNLQADRLRGFTSFGPHRDDISVLINGYPAADVASRGELRSIMLAMKLIEVDTLKDIFGSQPLLLLDDVFSELDATRRNTLVAVMKQTQTIITTTDADTISDQLHATILRTNL